MGVQGLWQLLASVGSPVPLEGFENKVLAVDISIWLNQALKGYRDAKGRPLNNAHLLGLFHRLCKLLFYRVKPVVVFDGGAPQLKKQTLTERQIRKEVAETKSNKAQLKICANYLASQLLNSKNRKQKNYALPSSHTSDDLYELPPLPECNTEEENENLSDVDVNFDQSYLENAFYHTEDYQDLSSVDIESEDFHNLPYEIKQEILLAIRENRKRKWTAIDQFPEESHDFSKYQLDNLLRNRHLQQKITEVEREMNSAASMQTYLQYLDNEEDGEHFLETRKIASEDFSHLILMKKLQKSPQKRENKTPHRSESYKKKDVSCDTVESSLDNTTLEAEDKTNSQSLPQSWLADIASTDNWSVKDDKDFNTAREKSYHVFYSLSEEEQSVDGMFNQIPIVLETSEFKCREIANINNEPLSNKEALLKSSNIELTEHNIRSEANEDNYIKMSKIDSEVIPVQYSKQKICNAPLYQDVTMKLPENAKNLPSDKDTLVCERLSDNTTAENSVCHSLKELNETVISDDSELKEEDVTVLSQCKEYEKSKETFTSESGLKTSVESVMLSNNSSRSFLNDDSFEKETQHVVTTENKIDVKTPNALIEVDESKKCSSEKCCKVSLPLSISPKENLTHARSETREKNTENSLMQSQTDDSHRTSIAFPSKEQSINESDEDGWQIISPETESLHETAQEMLRLEAMALQSESAQQQRMANTVNEQMYAEIQDLLHLFGIPYIMSPMEAEAQCAFLDFNDLTHGTITDDSDVWLFGGCRVYRNFFKQKKYVEFFKNTEISSHFGLTRQKLINFAMLTGCDYAQGIEGVGPVTAMEILSEFPEDGLDALYTFKSWWDSAQKSTSSPGNKTRAKLQNLVLPSGFPNPVVYEAFINPTVNTSKEPFSWSTPDLDGLREFVREKFGWNKAKADGILLPVMKSVNNKQSQTHIESFFMVQLKKHENLFPSKRIQSAVKRLNTTPPKKKQTKARKMTNSKTNKKDKVLQKKTTQRGKKGQSSEHEAAYNAEKQINTSHKRHLYNYAKNFTQLKVQLSEESSESSE